MPSTCGILEEVKVDTTWGQRGCRCLPEWRMVSAAVSRRQSSWSRLYFWSCGVIWTCLGPGNWPMTVSVLASTTQLMWPTFPCGPWSSQCLIYSRKGFFDYVTIQYLAKTWILVLPDDECVQCLHWTNHKWQSLVVLPQPLWRTYSILSPFNCLSGSGLLFHHNLPEYSFSHSIFPDLALQYCLW